MSVKRTAATSRSKGGATRVSAAMAGQVRGTIGAAPRAQRETLHALRRRRLSCRLEARSLMLMLSGAADGVVEPAHHLVELLVAGGERGRELEHVALGVDEQAELPRAL